MMHRKPVIPDIRVVIADDHEIFRDGLRMVLQAREHIKLEGEAADGRELVALVNQLKPDIVMTDIRMPVLDGIEATRQIIRRQPDTGIIAFSMFDEEHSIIDMLESGAKGYLLKNADKHEIYDAILSVYEGQSYYCKHTSFKMARLISQSRFNPHHRRERPEFSDREREIIDMICLGMTNREIGNRLFLSARTVEGYRQKIQEKMNARNTVGIVIYAIRHNLHDPEARQQVE